MKKFLLAAAVAAMSLSFGLPTSSAAVLYDANTTVGADGAFFGVTPSLLQVVTTGAPNVAQKINSFTVFGVRNYTATASGAQALFIDFYTNVDETGGSADAIGAATLVGSVGYNLPSIPANTSANFTLPSVNVNLPGNKVGVVVQLANAAGTAFSTSLSGRYSTGTPSVGSNDGFIYEDINLDGAYAGSERVQVNGAVSLTPVPTNLRFAMDVTVPEPVSLSALAMGGMIFARRRRA